MYENDMMELDLFLSEHGFQEEQLTDKEKIKILRNIVFQGKVDLDLEELRHEKNRETSDVNEYLNRINNIQINIGQANSYILMIRQIVREKKKLKRIEYIKSIKTKVKSIFVK